MRRGGGADLLRLGIGGSCADLAKRRVWITLHCEIPKRHNAHRLPPFDYGYAANGMRAHEPHGLFNAVRGGHGH